MSGGSMLGAVSFKVKRRNRMTSGGGNIAGMTRMMRLLAGEAWTDVAHIFFQAGDGIRYIGVTGVQTCALPICRRPPTSPARRSTSTAVSSRDSEGAAMPVTFGFDGQTVLITGAATGLGFAAAEAFGRAGARDRKSGV